MRQRTSTPSSPRAAGRSATAARGGRGAMPPTRVVAVALGVAIGLVYGVGLHGRNLRAPFIFDDLVTVLGNGSITSLWPLIGPADQPGPLNPPADLPTSGRPLVNLTFAMNYAIGQFDPFGYHLVNTLIHFLNAMLAWSLVRRALLLPYFAGRFDQSAGRLAMAVALLWSLHPLQTETVIYATQRTELMVTLFYLATLYCSLRYWESGSLSMSGDETAQATHLEVGCRRRTIWLLSAFLACLAGMASKEVMASAPLVVLLFERTFITGSIKVSLQRSWPLYAALASTWIVLLYLALGAPHGESAGFHVGIGAYEWWLTQQKVLLMYLKLVAWPSPLLIHYQLPYLKSFEDAWSYVVPVAAVGVAVLVLLWRNRPLGFLGAWAFAILLPTMIVPILTEMAAERRMYLPLLAITVSLVVACHLLVVGSRSFSYRRPAAIALVGFLAVALGFASASRLAAYEDERILWRQVLNHQPDNYLAHNNLGQLLVTTGEVPEAITELQTSVAEKPDFAAAHNNLGVALMHASRNEEAVEVLQQAVKIDPNYSAAWLNFGNALKNLGKLPEAIEHIEHSIQLSPNDSTAHNNLGVVLAAAGKSAQAIEQFQEAIRLDPTDTKCRLNLAQLFNKAGNYKEAFREYTFALELQPNRADVHNSLGAMLGEAGRPHEAIEHFQQALQIDPNFIEAYSNLALALAMENRAAEAIAISQRGIAVARASGQMQAARKAEEWLSHYQTELKSADQLPKR